MNRFQLYNKEEIENLKREIEIYKSVVRTMKDKDVDYFLKVESENYELKLKLSKLKGEMEVMEKRINEMGKVEELFNEQLEKINTSINQLKSEINDIKSMVGKTNIEEIVKKLNQAIEKMSENISTNQHEKPARKEVVDESIQRSYTRAKSSDYSRIQEIMKNIQYSNQLINNQNPKQNIPSFSNNQAIKTFSNSNFVTQQNSMKNFNFPVNKNIIKTLTTYKTKKRKNSKEEESEKSHHIKNINRPLDEKEKADQKYNKTDSFSNKESSPSISNISDTSSRELYDERKENNPFEEEKNHSAISQLESESAPLVETKQNQASVQLPKEEHSFNNEYSHDLPLDKNTSKFIKTLELAKLLWKKGE